MGYSACWGGCRRLRDLIKPPAPHNQRRAGVTLLADSRRGGSSRGAEGDRQLRRHAEERRAPFDRLGDERKIREPAHQRPDRDLALEPREMRAEAEVRAAAEGE